MKTITTIFPRACEIILGLIFIIFGINGLFTFIPVPEFSQMMEILVDSNYIVVVKLLEIAGGLCLILRRYLLIGLLILGPIIINILLYHIFIDPRYAAVGYFNLITYLVIVYKYRENFKPLFRRKI